MIHVVQALFAARVISDIVGRIVPRARWVSTKSGLKWSAAFKLGLTPLFFFYISGFTSFRSDALALGYVILFWFTSGYVNTVAYVAAPDWAPPGGASRAGGAMALVFQTSCLLGLAVAFLVEQWSAAVWPPNVVSGL